MCVSDKEDGLYRGFIALGRPVLRDICASLHSKPFLRSASTSRSYEPLPKAICQVLVPSLPWLPSKRHLSSSPGLSPQLIRWSLMRRLLYPRQSSPIP